jgi:hypothetical protein
MFYLQWTEATGKDGRMTAKEKAFRTEKARESFANLVSEKENFIKILAWGEDPKPKGENR